MVNLQTSMRKCRRTDAISAVDQLRERRDHPTTTPLTSKGRSPRLPATFLEIPPEHDGPTVIAPFREPSLQGAVEKEDFRTSRRAYWFGE